MKKTNIFEKITIFNLVVTPLVFFPNQDVFDYYYLPKHIILTICSLLFLLQIWISRKNLKKYFVFDKTTIILLVYIALMIISTIFALDVNLAIQGTYLRHEGLSTIFMYILMFFAAKSSTYLDYRIFKYMIITATIIALYGILQYFGFDVFLVEYSRSSFTPYSSIGNPNFLGTYLVLMMPFALHFWNTRKNFLSLIAYDIILFCLLATMSRGPWLGAISSIGVYFIFQSLTSKGIDWKSFIYFFANSFVVILVFMILSDKSLVLRFLAIFSDFSKIIDRTNDAESTGTFRWFIWIRVVALIRERPLIGFGISNLGPIFDLRYHQDVLNTLRLPIIFDEAHNEFLDIAVSSGIPSLFAYLYFVYTCLKTKFNQIKKNNQYVFPIFASIIGYLVQSFFNISVVSVAFIFWTFLGLISKESNINEK